MLIRSREFVCHVHSPARIYRGRQYDDGNGGGYEDAGGRRRNKEMGDTFLGPGYSRLCSSPRLTPSAMRPLKRELSRRFTATSVRGFVMGLQGDVVAVEKRGVFSITPLLKYE